MIKEILDKLLDMRNKEHNNGDHERGNMICEAIEEIKREFPEPEKIEVIFMDVEPGKEFHSMSTGAKCKKTKNYKVGGHEFNAVDDDGYLCWFSDQDTATVYR